MKVIKISPDNAGRFYDSIASLERGIYYPLGTDAFQIDHGKDYFAFFRRLGELHYYACEHHGKVVAVVAGILREVPFVHQHKKRLVWYLCDLKVDPNFRGQRLPFKFVKAAWFPNYIRCGRGYAISMNPDGNIANRVVKLVSRFRVFSFRFAGTLLLYALDYARMQECRAYLEECLGPLAFLSLRGKKDLVLKSSGQSLSVLHLQHGPCAEEGQKHAMPGHTHMFCLPKKNPLNERLASLRVFPTARASIISHRIAMSDWNFILTSDI